MSGKSKKHVSAVSLEFLHMQIVDYVMNESNLPPEKCYSVLENLGFRFGQRVGARWKIYWKINNIHRFGRGQTRLHDNLDIIKFICKEVWMEMFNKHVDKLETDHKVGFILK